MEEFQQSHNALLQQRIDTYNELSKMRILLENLNKKVQSINHNISKNCIKHNKQHEWESYRESGHYGERYYICKHCNTTQY
jgi:predicted DNA binding CopG/RHH family protein